MPFPVLGGGVIVMFGMVAAAGTECFVRGINESAEHDYYCNITDGWSRS